MVQPPPSRQPENGRVRLPVRSVHAARAYVAVFPPPSPR